MTNIWYEMLAGFIATTVLSLIMLMKETMILMPELDIIGMLGDMMGAARELLAGSFIS